MQASDGPCIPPGARLFRICPLRADSCRGAPCPGGRYARYGHRPGGLPPARMRGGVRPCVGPPSRGERARRVRAPCATAWRASPRTAPGGGDDQARAWKRCEHADWPRFRAWMPCLADRRGSAPRQVRAAPAAERLHRLRGRAAASLPARARPASSKANRFVTPRSVMRAERRRRGPARAPAYHRTSPDRLVRARRPRRCAPRSSNRHRSPACPPGPRPPPAFSPRLSAS